MTQIHFCSLAIGDMGKPGYLTIKSILEVTSAKLFLLTDPAGKYWASESFKNEKDAIDRIVYLSVPESEMNDLAQLDKSSRYVEFGEPKFFRLMFQKWFAILEALRYSAAGDLVIFSDLDIIWMRDPIEPLARILKSDVSFAIQEDFELRNNTSFACPGIMVWQKKEKAIDTLREVRAFHLKLLENNPDMPDDKAVNFWLNSGSNSHSVAFLKRDEFVIGHRLVQMFLGIQGFSMNSLVAFHANYQVGLRDKERVMRYVSKAKKKRLMKYLWAIKLLLLKIAKRLFGKK